MDNQFLMIGEFIVTDKPVIIETVLGSCVSVCLFNLVSKKAAMNHFLLDIAPIEYGDDIGRYGLSATEHLINTLMADDKNSENYVAQIFGGAMLVEKDLSGSDIGDKNIRVARRVLNLHRIRIIRQDIGGIRGRCVRFNTASNTVFCEFTDRVEQNQQS